MKILFINANLYGHINPTLGLTKKLAERGNQVNYFCSEDFSEQIKSTGAKWISFGNQLDQFLKAYRPTDRHPFYMLMEYILSYDEAVLPELLEIISKDNYDMVICDSVFGGGCFLKQLVKIPVVCSHSSFAMSHAPVPSHMLQPGTHPQLDHCYEILKRMCNKYKIGEPSLDQIFISKGERNIVYTTPKFNGDNLIKAPEYLFAGPSLDRKQEAESIDIVDNSKKIIYIALGSFNTDFIEFYKLCIAAFGDTDYVVYMSVGKKSDISQLGLIPKNFIVRPFLPQLDILKHASAFITHAGFNSVNEALYFGVPMLALPQVNDQYMVAKRLSSMNLGITDDMKELTIQKLQTEVETLISDDKMKNDLLLMSQEMRNSTGVEKTAEVLENYSKAWKEI